MQFKKISEARYNKDFTDGKVTDNGYDYVYLSYDKLQLPKRATQGSAGYDFVATRAIDLEPGQEVIFPTGVRLRLDDDKFLAVYPRSSLGFKHRLVLCNTVGIVDSDYYRSKNEGHIWIKIYLPQDAKEGLHIRPGQAVCQGIIQQYFKVDNDDTTAVRDGGIGSTDS